MRVVVIETMRQQHWLIEFRRVVHLRLDQTVA